MPPFRAPVSTYRLQLNRDFRFEDARSIVPYLAQLGISDIYCSPIFRARPGSQHGYDVVDPTTINPELGGEDGFNALVAELRRNGMGLLLDIVPNHMATSPENAWWMDVLEHGPESKYARFFDVDWQSSFGKPNLEDKVLLPILGKPYGEALAAGELKVSWRGGKLWIHYSDHDLPVARSSYDLVLRGMKDRPGAAVQRINSDPAKLDQLLESQFFRLAFWRLAAEELNYRRFFDIGELIGVRVEDEQVFRHTHSLVDRLMSSGEVSGLRIDHVDGLHDPITYLQRARQIGGSGRNYVLVEKILDAEEQIPEEMETDGTTGYDFLNRVNSVFVDPEGVRSLQRTYREFTGIEDEFAQIVYQRKKRAVARLFAGEVGRLSRHLASISARDLVARDIPLIVLVQSLIDVTSSLPVYRTYINSRKVSERDRRYIDSAIERAERLEGDERRLPAYQFLRRLLTLTDPPPDVAEEWLRFVMQWQQLTGPAMAKGFEDTVLYVYHPLLSLNEVGGDPEFHRKTSGLQAFHERNLRFLRRWPHSMNATTTHDTKRSEGARARLNVLSEIPEEWRRRVRRWRSLNEELKSPLHGSAVPDGNEEMFLYQALLGSWPLTPREVPDFKKRFRVYLVKAARESKTHSSWIEPREDYERRLLRFCNRILKVSGANRFLEDFLDLHSRIAFFGVINSLAQMVLKATAPGVPDFYQGSESWDFSMVDPDNRRPVDYRNRATMLRQISAIDLSELLGSWRDGKVKVFATQRALAARHRNRDVFATGDYIPLHAAGVLKKNLCAFARTDGKRWVVVAVPRFNTQITRSQRFPLGRLWKDTRLALPGEAPRSWRNAFSGNELSTTRRALPLSSVFAEFPVAILEGN